LGISTASITWMTPLVQAVSMMSRMVSSWFWRVEFSVGRTGCGAGLLVLRRRTGRLQRLAMASTDETLGESVTAVW
jgi:hypothetical protein